MTKAPFYFVILCGLLAVLGLVVENRYLVIPLHEDNMEDLSVPERNQSTLLEQLHPSTSELVWYQAGYYTTADPW